MTLLTAGYWPTTYWTENYWNPNYWLKYGLVTDSAGATAKRPELSPYLLKLVRDYLQSQVTR